MDGTIVPKGEDPRRYGFNYGAGWGREPKPPIYDQAMELADRLRQLSQEASQTSWALDHALWRVRIAETPAEKQQAISELRAEVFKHLTIRAPK